MSTFSASAARFGSTPNATFVLKKKNLFVTNCFVVLHPVDDGLKNYDTTTLAHSVARIFRVK